MRKVAFIVLIALTAAIPSSGYITQRKLLGNAILQVKWPSFPVTWGLVPVQGTNITGSRTLSQVANTSYGTWDAVATATIAFTRGADVAASTAYGYDGVNILKTNLTAQEYSQTGAGDALAITGTVSSAVTGDVLDADIIFNPTVPFSTDPTTPSNRIDFEAVLTHEIGHLLGLDHSAILAATMFPRIGDGVSAPRALTADDIAGVSSLYPTASYLTKGSISGTVRLTSNASVYGAIVVAVNANGQPAAHGVTDKFGNYTIYGLDSGTYTIYAEPMDSPFSFDDQGVFSTIFPGSTVSTNFTTRFR
jgi:hypothetical protein